jgi:hypothetical protein
MDYQKIYNDLVFRAQNREKPSCYTERHHIVPKSMGGLNNKDNLVILTAREHFIAHILLYKIYKNQQMAYALCAMAMRTLKHIKITSRQYAYIREQYSLAQKGKNNPNYGKKHSPESKEKISLTKKGKKLSEEHKKNLHLAWVKRKQKNAPLV